MRKPNIEIKRVNLAKAELQLAQYEAQVGSLRIKLNEVVERYEAKRKQVETLQNEITALFNNETPVKS